MRFKMYVMQSQCHLDDAEEVCNFAYDEATLEGQVVLEIVLYCTMLYCGQQSHCALLICDYDLGIISQWVMLSVRDSKTS